VRRVHRLLAPPASGSPHPTSPSPTKVTSAPAVMPCLMP
jgi:hypothetical protein